MKKLADLKLQYGDFIITTDVLQLIAQREAPGLTKAEVNRLMRDACAAVDSKSISDAAAVNKVVGFILEIGKNSSYNKRVSMVDTDQERSLAASAEIASRELTRSITEHQQQQGAANARASD